MVRCGHSSRNLTDKLQVMGNARTVVAVAFANDYQPTTAPTLLSGTSLRA